MNVIVEPTCDMYGDVVLCLCLPHYCFAYGSVHSVVLACCLFVMAISRLPTLSICAVGVEAVHNAWKGRMGGPAYAVYYLTHWVSTLAHHTSYEGREHWCYWGVCEHVATCL